MGLFKRSGAGNQDDSKGRAAFGHAAFDPADVEDARRGKPAVSLQTFAQATGLDFRGNEQAGAFVSTLPTWPDYIFNVCRGAMPSGRLGMLAHELFEAEAHNGSIRAAGEYFDVRVNTRMGGLEVAGIAVAERKNEPFAGNAVWIPTTTVHVRAPETNRLPVMRITKSGSFGVIGDNGLDKLGLPGFRVLRGDEDQQALAAVAQACQPWLPTRPDAHVNLRVRYGLVALTVNGYRASNGDLHHLIATTDGIAQALAALAHPTSGINFDALGPEAGTTPRAPGIPLPHPLLVPQYAQQAGQWGLHNEDDTHLTMLLPRCAIPGIASGVLAGTFPGTATTARVVWFEQGGRTSGSVRGGVVVRAIAGAATPLGGVLNDETGMYVEVVDGFVYCWRKQRSFGKLEADVLLSSAVTTLRSSGIAAL